MYLYLFTRRNAWMSEDMAISMSHFLKSNKKQNKLCDVTPFLYANVYYYSKLFLNIIFSTYQFYEGCHNIFGNKSHFFLIYYKKKIFSMLKFSVSKGSFDGFMLLIVKTLLYPLYNNSIPSNICLQR